MTEIRADIVDVYPFRVRGGAIELLQLLRTREPMAGSWHPLMGHTDPSETAAACALRELEEETGLARGDPALLGFWQLEQVNPYFVASIDAVVLGPRFCARVDPAWEPTLNEEHSGARWIDAADAAEKFYWPGQRAACAEVARIASEPGSAYERALRIKIG